MKYSTKNITDYHNTTSRALLVFLFLLVLIKTQDT